LHSIPMNGGAFPAWNSAVCMMLSAQYPCNKHKQTSSHHTKSLQLRKNNNPCLAQESRNIIALALHGGTGFQRTPQTKGEKEEDQIHYPVFWGTYIHTAKTVEGEKQ
jgi:hypothetical protein